MKTRNLCLSFVALALVGSFAMPENAHAMARHRKDHRQEDAIKESRKIAEQMNQKAARETAIAKADLANKTCIDGKTTLSGDDLDRASSAIGRAEFNPGVFSILFYESCDANKAMRYAGEYEVGALDIDVAKGVIFTSCSHRIGSLSFDQAAQVGESATQAKTNGQAFDQQKFVASFKESCDLKTATDSATGPQINQNVDATLGSQVQGAQAATAIDKGVNSSASAADATLPKPVSAAN